MKRLLAAIFTLFFLAANAQQNTLLTPAFWQGKPDAAAIKAEVDKGNSPSQFNGSNFDPVVMAINADASTESIKYLLSQPGNEVNKVTHDSRNYLHWAASKGNTEVMEYLLSKGAVIDNEDSHGSTPLFFAAGAAQSNTKVYDLLIAKGADLKKDVNSDGANVLLLAIANDKELALTNYFVSKGLDLNSTDAAGNNAFSYAARSGNVEVLKSLVQKGIKPNPYAMLMAAQGSRRGANTIEVYQYLESLNIKPAVTGKNGENVLHAIVRKQNQTDIIKYFLARGVDVNQQDEEGNSVFMNAVAANRDTAVIVMLLPHIKNINLVNEKGVSALAMAVRGNLPGVVSYLIGKGAVVKGLDKSGNTLAYYALESYRPAGGPGFGGPGGQAPSGGRPGAQGGPGQAGAGRADAAGRPGERTFNGPKPEDFETKIKILQKEGLDITAPQENGNSLYHLAVVKNDISLLKRLQPLGLDVNAKNKEGFTALHKAALISKDDVVLKYLLSIGAKTDVKTNFEETAFDLASENEYLTKNNVSLTFLK
ncbi:ankyrin repeat domain-containing protein [Pedobacter metabolipauper]|uniref:Ankyrin repeat protein n=1 Tax=Pedobacter metabolipauper TaxID=425513 RepID=A0A4R6SS91_9SPHI|nr:ankyrin repeat domain-containing protein [Pedobacter metabolipauper]TDQ06613.1 ankyrin repeat protein [Pedobacter metabolipauper]